MPNKKNVLNPYCGGQQYVQLTSLASATALSGVPSGVIFAWIQAETQAVRWRADGVNPTASVGSVIAAGATLEFSGDMTAIRLIEVTASAKVNIVYFV